MSKEKPVLTDGQSVSGAAVAVLLGSGLGEVSNRFPVEATVPFAEIPGLSDAGVEGHSGLIRLVTVESHKCLFIEGRKHFYEGNHSQIGALVSFIAATGVRELIVTSACGSLDSALPPGQLVLTSDVLDLQMRQPHHTGPLGASSASSVASSPSRDAKTRDGMPSEKTPQTPRMPLGQPLDGGLGERLERAALSAQVPIRRGVIACNAGPAYETPAEIEALGRIGVSVVTMSGAPEISIAHELGIRVASLALVTNWASGISACRLSHDEVLAVARRAAGQLREVVRLFVCNKES